MKHLICGVAFSTLLLAPVSAQTNLTLISTNDIDQFESFSGLSGVVAAERAAGGNVLFLHAGDSYSPSILSGIDQGAHIVELLNIISPDFMVLGNHEFDFGPQVMVDNLANPTYPVLAGNVVTPDGGSVPYTRETALIDVEGFTVGIYGLTSEDAEVKSSVGDYDITDALEAAARHKAALKEAGAQLIIALVHLNFAEDLRLVNSGLADVIISGDDHNQLTFFDGRTALMESGEQGEVVTALDISMSIDDRDRFRWSPSFRIIDSAAYEPTPEIAAQIAALEASLSEELAEVIGVTQTEMNTTRPVIRGQEATFGNLLTDAMRAAMGTDIGLTNGGGIRAKAVYAPGTELTAGDILAELPFGNKTVVLELTGAQLIEALENGFSEVENGAGRFPHVSGMTVRVELSAEPFSRVLEVHVDGAPLDPAARYSIATNDYMAGGGDGYGVLKDATVLVSADDSVLMATQFIDYIRAAGTVAPEIEGRISQ